MTNVRLQLCFGYDGAHWAGLTTDSRTVGAADITPVDSLRPHA
ncbi:hypothetical protein [Streptomyces enissocaesilis]|uniref:Uncharacterized protein n=1 Tax=Streptomyces enissocaesilis TaxID=332589 RepID=A0ABN3XDY7_9ACTN